VIPAKLNLICPQGTTFLKTFRVYDENDAPFDLTGYTAAMQVREKYPSTTYLFQVTTGSGITISGSTITVEVHYSVTTDFREGDYVWDIEITSPADKRDRVLQGIFMVTPEVTR
jgi:LEA14-like dessication related protein